MVMFASEPERQVFRGRVLGLRCPPLSGCWGLEVRLDGGMERTYWADWRMLRDAAAALELRRGDAVEVVFEAEWSWVLRRA